MAGVPKKVQDAGHSAFGHGGESLIDKISEWLQNTFGGNDEVKQYAEDKPSDTVPIAGEKFQKYYGEKLKEAANEYPQKTKFETWEAYYQRLGKWKESHKE